MSKKAWIIFGAIILVVLGFIILTNSGSSGSGSIGQPQKLTSSDIVFGSTAKKIVIIEYLDFECPHCQELFPYMQAMHQQYGNQVTFVERFFPLTQIHPNAFAAARAAYAALQQGQYAAMEQRLFNNQDTWAPLSSDKAQVTFQTYAEELGLDMKKFNTDYASQAAYSTINSDIQDGDDMGVNGTPTLFLNGKLLTYTQYSGIDTAIANAIKYNETDPYNYRAPKTASKTSQ
jgi:protein-disulfide isomerase